MNHLKQAAIAIWQNIFGPPILNAREEHKQAIKAQRRAEAELSYHTSLADYFDAAAYEMDPHDDWHHFASLKDSWLEHTNDAAVELKRHAAATAKVRACEARLAKIKGQQT